MTQSFSQIYLHLIFSTKGRFPFLRDPPFRHRLHAYLAQTCHNQGCPSLIVGGVEDHVHLLCRLAKTVEVANLVRELKRESSKWIKDEVPRLGDFHWQTGYGAFSISPGHVEQLTTYIRGQDAHHRTESFQDEFRRICARYDIEIDERFAWDCAESPPPLKGIAFRGLGSATRDTQSGGKGKESNNAGGVVQ